MSVKPPAAPERPDSEGAHANRAGKFGIDGVSGFMGMRWDSADTVRLEIRPELINAGGLLSGVVTYALIDYCMGSTLWVQTTEEEHIATINIAINYIQIAPTRCCAARCATRTVVCSSPRSAVTRSSPRASVYRRPDAQCRGPATVGECLWSARMS
jgi:hypothetical protein